MQRFNSKKNQQEALLTKAKSDLVTNKMTGSNYKSKSAWELINPYRSGKVRTERNV